MPVTDSETMVMVDATLLAAGSDFGPRYRIESLLGQGGMGRVYKAYDKDIDRTVALKVIRHAVMGETDALKRFKQELHLASKISHKNILRIHDMGEVGGTKFITMAYVEGQDLYGILKEHPKMPIERVLKFATQLAEALAAAHAEGVIHRDLKPQNILVNKDDQIFVSDFGLAKSFEEGAQGMTKTGAFLGTPRYMSPEQVEGKPADQRSDLYAYGLIFYEMVTGDVPFTGESTLKVMYQRIQEKPKNPKLVNPSLPTWVARIIMRCLEKDPAARYQTAYEILADLQGSKPSGGSRSLQIQIPEFARSRWAWVAGSVVGALLLVSALLVLRGKLPFGSSAKGGAPGPQISLAILPFRNASGDQTLNWLGPGLAEMLTTDVGKSSTLRIVSADRLHQILNDLHISPDTELDQGTLGRIADFTNADRLVSGQYVKFGNQIRIDATLQTLKQQHTVSLKAEAPDEKEVLRAVDQLAQMIQQNLALSSASVKELKGAAFTPSSNSVQALRDYNEGLQLTRQANYVEAVKSFEAATKEDQNFALAYAKLAETYSNLGNVNQAEQFSRKAVDLSGSLPQAERLQILATSARIENDTRKAIEAYENLARLSPDDSDVEFNLASLYASINAFDQARGEFTKLLSRDPKYVDALIGMGRTEISAGNSQNALEYLNRALTLSIQLGNDVQRAATLHSLGVAYRELGKLDDALRNLQESLSIKQRLNDKRGVALTLNAMAQAQSRLGKSSEALKSYQEALRLREAVGDKKGSGDTLIDMGNLYGDWGQYDQALKFYKESLQIQHDAGDVTYEGLCLNNIGNVYFNMGQYDDALTFFQQALQTREKLKIPVDTAMTLHNIGDTSARVGQFDQALTYYLRALELWRNAGDRLWQAIESDSIGSVYEYQGRYGAALRAKEEAQKTVREVGERGVPLADILSNYGNELSLVGRDDEAQKILEEALGVAKEAKSDPKIAQTLDFQGDRLFYRGDFKGSQGLYEQALQFASKTKDPYAILLTKVNLAKAAIKQGRSQAAIKSLGESAKDAEAHRLKYISVECSLYLGEALLATKDYARARQELETAQRKGEDLKAQVLLAKIHYLLGTTLRLTGNQADASRHYADARRILEEIQKEAHSDDLLKRSDLSPIVAESTH
jgi:tetratricopeptide (TPR) repeat protein/tRNA A-37 threonylcarbamoyl transferase component Bud32